MFVQHLWCIATGNRHRLFHINLAGGAAAITETWRFRKSVNSCIEQILCMDGSRMQKELANIMLRRYHILAFTFEEVIRSKAYSGGVYWLASLTRMGEKTTLLSPDPVVTSGIPCCRLVQNPGEFVMTFPRAYHIGFYHDSNIKPLSLKVSIVGKLLILEPPKWLSVAKEAAVHRAAMNFLPMLFHQQLLYLLTMSFIPRVPRSLLLGIRSSRLKDHQKEEHELLAKKEFSSSPFH
ncbi:unnamed protein product [Lactuca saligna]|uniref:JmjC domain-containing protein n=1 Tax=Lactuca saligna TaxID=75948 RepID=A0AA35ZJA9_LACSI|nr:unnamed protein product [Lactuca saligna]